MMTMKPILRNLFVVTVLIQSVVNGQVGDVIATQSPTLAPTTATGNKPTVTVAPTTVSGTVAPTTPLISQQQDGT